MWEWSNKLKKKPEEKPSTSLLAAYDDLLSPSENSFLFRQTENGKPSSLPGNPDQEPPSSSEMKQIVRDRLTEYSLTEMNILERAYDPQSWQEMSNFFDEYQRARSYFLKLVGYSETDACRNLGMSRQDIRLLKEGISPENFNVHIKIPFDFGGTLDFGNFSLVRTHPTHGQIHKIIDLQIENNFLRKNKKIFLPYFEGKIYND